ncbi:MAG: C69 family dipeptidase [Candidatus Kariarchaeaceae archaeon]
MCDTFVALGSATIGDYLIFGKNSDRPFNEPQPVVYIPEKSFPSDAQVNCTYISIPQVETTKAVLLSKPDWMWGAEMGANDKVVIGNEAVWTKEKDGPPALLGMDLLRIALERSSSALNAVQIITSLLDAHGQGGGCAQDDLSFTYHNSFLIADATNVWILETAGEWWIAEHITDGIRNISNGLSIRSKFDLAREGLIDYAVDRGFCDSASSFDFARCFSYGNFSEPTAFSREGIAKNLLEDDLGAHTSETMMNILRSHSGSICMHGSFRTTASQVSQLSASPNDSTHWFTGSPHPCVSLFKPFSLLSELDQMSDFWHFRENNNNKFTEAMLDRLKSYQLEIIKSVSEKRDLGKDEFERILEEAIEFEKSLFEE